MSQTIEERVVQMKFDNKQFEKGVNNTIKQIGKLEDSLQFKHAEDGLDRLQKSVDGLDFGRLADAVDTIASRFTNMGIVGMQVLSNLGDKAVRMATDLVNKVAIQPVSEGMTKYFDMLSSTAVMKNAGESLSVIDKNLAQLMKYSDETSYSFTQMTAAASSFVNAGQSLEKSEKIIEGIANAAASAGVSTRNAQPIFNAFSKAMTKGELSLQQWYSLDASGFATQDFRKRLLAAGVATGKLNKNFEVLGKTVGKDKKAIKVTMDNLTETLTYGWVDRNVMANLFQSYAMDQAAYEMAQKARSFQDVWDATADAVSSSWLKTWQIVFGDLDKATDFFTNLANGIYDILMPWNDLRNSYFQELASGGAFDRIRTSFYALMEPVADISTALSNLFGGVIMSQVSSAITNIPSKLKGLTDALSTVADFITLTDDEVSSSKSWLLNPEKNGLLKGEQDVAGYFSYWQEFMPTMLRIKDGLSSIIELLRNVAGNIGSFIKGIFGQLGPTFSSLGKAFADIGGIVTTFVNLLLGNDPVYKNARTNKLQKFTQILLKILRPFTTIINKAAKAVQGFTEKVRKWLSKSKVQSSINKTFDNILSFFAKIPKKIEGALTWISTKVNAVSDWFSAILGDFKDPEDKTTTLEKLQDKWTKIKDWFSTTWEKLKGFLEGFFTPISDWFNGLIGDMSDPEKRTKLVQDIQGKWTKIKDWFSDTWTKIKDFLAPVTQPIADWFNDLAGDPKNPEARAKRIEELQGVWNSIKDWFSTTWTSIKDFLTPIADQAWTSVSTWFKNLTGDVTDAETGALSIELLQSKWEEIIGKIQAYWNDLVLPTVKPIGDFFSDLWASIFGGTGKDTEGGEEGIEQKAIDLEASFNRAWEAVVGFFTRVWNKITSLFGGKGGEKTSSNEKGPQDIADAVEEAKTNLPAIDFAGLAEKLKSILIGLGIGAGGFKLLDVIKSIATKDKTPKKSIFEKVGEMVHNVGEGLVMIAAAFAVMAIGVWAMSKMTDGEFMTGLLRVGTILLALVGVVGIIALAATKLFAVTTSTQFAMVGKAIKDMGAGLLMISSAALVCGLAIALLGVLPQGTLIQGGIALALVLTALTTVAVILNKSSGLLGGGTSLTTAASILALALSVLLLTVPVIALGMLPQNVLIQGGIAAVALLTAMALAIRALNGITPVQAGKAGLAVSAFIAAIGGGAAVVAWLATGVIEGIGNAIVEMASKLELAQGMLGSFDKVKFDAVLALYGDFVVQGLTWVGVDMSGVYAVGAAMLQMSQDIAIYAGNIKDLDFSNSAAALQAARDVASIAESINSIQNASELSTVIANVGAAIDLYYQHLAKVGGEGEGASVDPAKIATMFNDLVTNMPDDAQIKQIASFSEGGGNDLTSFALGLTNLGTALKDYANSVSDLNDTKMKTAEDALTFLGTLNTKLTANLAVVTLLGSYETPLQSSGGDIVTLGTALNDYATKTKDMDEGKIKTAENSLNFLATLQEKLPERGGLFSFLTGHKESLSEFATDMNTLGEGLGNFASKVQNAGFGTDTDNAIAFLERWVEMQTKLQGMTTSTLRIHDVAWDLKELNGTYFNEITEVVGKMKGFDASDKGVDNFIKFLNRFSIIQSHLVGMTEGSLRIEDIGYDLQQFVQKGYMNDTQTFVDKARAIDVAGMDNFIRFLNDFSKLESVAHVTDSMALESLGTDMKIFMETIGADMTEGMANGMESDTSKVEVAADRVGDKAVTSVKGNRSDFVLAGQYLVDGLAAGITAFGFKALNAVNDLGDEVVKAMRDVLGISSPSKVFAEIGMYSDMGMADGLLAYASLVENASGQVGENAISKSQEVMAQVSSALANDLDAAPRITPVLDMSQVEAGSARLNGLFGTRNIRVNAGIADGAASYTESRAGSFGYTGYDDRNVVEAVAAMNDRIAQLSDDIANLQIVLDTGILAGALTPKIDRKLGDLAALKGRSAFY